MRRLLAAAGLALVLVPFAVHGESRAQAAIIPVPTILPTVTVTATKAVTVPGPTMTVVQPGPTRTVSEPGPTRTVQTVTTHYATVPGPTHTVTVTGHLSTIRATVTVSPSPAPTVTTTEIRERQVKVTVPQAVGISAGFILVGIILGLLAVYISYVLGYKDSERAEARTWRSFRSELFGRK